MWTNLGRESDEPTETQLAQLGHMYFSWATGTSPAQIVWGNHVNRRPSSWPVFPRPGPACINPYMWSEMRYSRYKTTQILLTCQISLGLKIIYSSFLNREVDICIKTIFQAIDISVIRRHAPVCYDCSPQMNCPWTCPWVYQLTNTFWLNVAYKTFVFRRSDFVYFNQ